MNKEERKQEILTKRLEKNKKLKEKLQKKLEEIEQLITKDQEDLEIISLRNKKEQIDKIYEVFSKSELTLEEFLNSIGGNNEKEEN